MIDPTELDGTLAAWLATSGPRDVPARTIDAALAAARRRGQDGTVAVMLRGRTWPAGPTARRRWGRALLPGLAALLVVTSMATAFIVGSSRPEPEHEMRAVPPTPVTTIDPDLLPEGAGRAVPLDDGRLLMVGVGRDPSDPEAALIDSRTETVTAIPMIASRGSGYTLTKLPDGRVLVAGGFVRDEGLERTAAAEVFDRVTEAFSRVGDMTRERGPAIVIKVFAPVSVVLDDGRVLIVGGTTSQASPRYPSPGDLFDPAAGTFSATPALPCRRPDADAPTGQEIRSADLLPDGRVLLACEGWDSRPRATSSVSTIYYAFDVDDGSAELVDVGSNDVSSALSLPDRSVVLWERAGDDRLPSNDRIYRHRLLRFDPRSGATSALGPEPLSNGAITVLRSGHVLFAGGYKPDRVKPSASVQIVDPCTGESRVVATLSTTWTGGRATQLDEEHVLLVGGQLGLDPNMDQPAGPEVVALPALPAVGCLS